MRTTLILAAVAASFACSSAALASAVHEQHQGVPSIDRSIGGVISTMDADQHTITLSDGVTYAVPSYVDFGNLKPGEHVSVLCTYYLDKNYMEVKDVRAE